MKFSETANELKQTDMDLKDTNEELKKTAVLLGSITNTLAEKVPEEKQHLAEKSTAAERFKNVVMSIMDKNKRNKT
jgi:hypothetical protein